jgi:hypothetical protein
MSIFTVYLHSVLFCISRVLGHSFTITNDENNKSVSDSIEIMCTSVFYKLLAASLSCTCAASSRPRYIWAATTSAEFACRDPPDDLGLCAHRQLHHPAPKG